MVIFFKKGNRKDIKNYRPICLLSNMYKLFTKIITTRLEKKLDENQPREQAGFRSKYSTTDHIHAINQLKEKCREYNIPLCVAFVDYEKAFDSVQTQAILTSLQEQGIEDVYIEILKDIYTDSSVTVHLHKESEKIRIKRGVRQGDIGLERIHQVTNTIRIANIGWRIRICIREYTFFSEAINFIRQCSKFHTVIMLSNKSIYPLLKWMNLQFFYQHQLWQFIFLTLINILI